MERNEESTSLLYFNTKYGNGEGIIKLAVQMSSPFRFLKHLRDQDFRKELAGFSKVAVAAAAPTKIC